MAELIKYATMLFAGIVIGVLITLFEDWRRNE